MRNIEGIYPSETYLIILSAAIYMQATLLRLGVVYGNAFFYVSKIH